EAGGKHLRADPSKTGRNCALSLFAYLVASRRNHKKIRLSHRRILRYRVHKISYYPWLPNTRRIRWPRTRDPIQLSIPKGQPRWTLRDTKLEPDSERFQSFS